MVTYLLNHHNNVPYGFMSFVRKVQEISQIRWLMYCKSAICKSGQFEFDSVFYAGLEFRQKIHLSDGQVDLQNHLSVMKSTCPTKRSNNCVAMLRIKYSIHNIHNIYIIYIYIYILTLLYFSRTILPSASSGYTIGRLSFTQLLTSGFPSHCTISVHHLPSGFVAFPSVVVPLDGL